MDKFDWTAIIAALAGGISTLLGKLGWDNLINRRKIELENDATEIDLAEKLRLMNVELLEQVQKQAAHLIEMETRFKTEVAEYKRKYAELEAKYKILLADYEALAGSNGSRKKPDA